MEGVYFSVDVVNQKVLQVSSASGKVYGCAQEAFIKNVQLWLEVVHPDDLKIVESAMPSVTSDGKVMHSDDRIVRPDGSIRWVEAKIKPLVDEKKRLVRLDGVIADSTDKIRAENDL